MGISEQGEMGRIGRGKKGESSWSGVGVGEKMGSRVKLWRKVVKEKGGWMVIKEIGRKEAERSGGGLKEM